MSSWRATGLGFCLNHVEEAFGQLFRLKGYPEEYLEFDTNALLRSSFKEMIEALSKGTQRVMTIDEARGFLQLPKVKGGNEILVQMQDVPISMAGQAAAKPASPANDDVDDKPEPPEDDDESAQKVLANFRKGRARAAIGP